MYSTYQFVQNHLKTIPHPLELMLLHRLIRLQYQAILEHAILGFSLALDPIGLEDYYAARRLLSAALKRLNPKSKE